MLIEWILDVDFPDSILRKMQQYADRAPACAGISVPCSVSVRLCSDVTIAEINTVQRGIPRSTDVLSFPTVSWRPGTSASAGEKLLRAEYDDETGSCFLGDIVIAVPHVFAQAAEYGHSAEREACYLLIHGICHLLGYDHMQDQDKQIMRAMEEKILSGLDC